MIISRPALKPIIWIGSSYDDLRAFPECVRKDAGYQLHKIQAGLEATDWKPMAEIGAGVAEIRLRDHAGAFRIFYLARFEDALYVLHCFHKSHSAHHVRIKQLPGRVIALWLSTTGAKNENDTRRPGWSCDPSRCQHFC